MPTCQHCHYEWSYKQTLKMSRTLDPAMPCPHCGTKQFLSKKARRKTSMLNFLPPGADFTTDSIWCIHYGILAFTSDHINCAGHYVPRIN